MIEQTVILDSMLTPNQIVTSNGFTNGLLIFIDVPDYPIEDELSLGFSLYTSTPALGRLLERNIVTNTRILFDGINSNYLYHIPYSVMSSGLTCYVSLNVSISIFVRVYLYRLDVTPDANYKFINDKLTEINTKLDEINTKLDTANQQEQELLNNILVLLL